MTHEDTLILSALSGVEPCDCDGCLAALGKVAP